MEPLFKKNVDSATSFTLKDTIGQSFNGIWHFHDEYELVYIWEGKGQKIVGDNISELRKGNLLFLGSDLPHSFSCNQDYRNKEEAGSLVVHLNDQFLRPDFFSCPELKNISRLFERANSGIEFEGAVNLETARRIRTLFEMNTFECFLEILSILNNLAKTDRYHLLASPGYTPSVSKKAYQRINRVYKFVMDHFQEDISLDQVTDITNMTKAAFCRYFKKVTGKTFFTYLNEYRVGHACKLLMQTNLNVSEICYKSGYNSISNFNKQFKAITETSPVRYKNKFKNEA